MRLSSFLSPLSTATACNDNARGGDPLKARRAHVDALARNLAHTLDRQRFMRAWVLCGRQQY